MSSAPSVLSILRIKMCICYQKCFIIVSVFCIYFIKIFYYQVDRAMRKRVFGHMRTAKTQNRLRIRAV